MKCPRCQQENPLQANFCLECGAPARPGAGDARAYADLKDDNDRLRQSLREALEQQTATGEILSTISHSPTDVRPVFETILERAAQLCEAELASLWLYDGGGWFRLGAAYGGRPDYLQWLRREPRRFERPFFREGGPWRAGQILDVRDTEPYRRGDPFWARTADHEGMRTLLGVPLVKDGRLVGSISVYRREVRQFIGTQVALVTTFAEQAVIAIENVRLFTELQKSNGELTEALEQQTATAEILRVISSSPTDVQPVFDAIVRTGVRLCGADYGFLARYDGTSMAIVAHSGATNEEIETVLRVYPMAPTPDSLGGRTILERAVIHIPDVRSDPTYGPRVIQDAGWRTGLGVPLLREGAAIGVVGMWRRDVRPFSDRQIELLKVFADQAIIAIENARLFNELDEKNRALTESLEQQTATSEILRVISSSPTDVQPVLEMIAQRSGEVCDGFFCVVFMVQGDHLHLRASHNIPTSISSVFASVYPAPLTSPLRSVQAVREGRAIAVADMQDEAGAPPGLAERSRAYGLRSWVAVPMMQGGRGIGAIAVGRREMRPFSEKDIALLQTFADQAVIAVENVRLFKELQASNRDLTEALDQQTATAEVLRVISRSGTDLQPVFDTILQSAVRLCDALNGFIWRVEDDLRRQVSYAGVISPEWLAIARGTPPGPPTRDSVSGWVQIERDVLHVPDLDQDERFPRSREMARAMRYRSLLAVPILRDQDPVGVIVLHKADPFHATQIQLVRTFADQAVIAIENARLLSELQTRTGELTRSVDELTALGEVGRALSSTLDIEAVLETIVTRAVQIAATAGCTIWEYDKPHAEFRLRASHYADQADAAVLQAPGRATAIPRGQGVTTLVMEKRQPVQIHDITTASDYESPIRQLLIDAGHRALLGVPLLSEDEVVGVLAVTRRTPGEFEPETVRLMSTFATQSALAIQNARLFREIEVKSRELEAASRHKSEFLANMSHELRTPLNAIIGFSEVLGERMFGELNEKQDEYLKDIHASGQHLLSLINDILDLSKIEAGRMELEVSHFDLPMTIDNALMLVRERAARRSVELHKSVDERLGQIQADERKIRQVLLNLLSNAIKYTPEGGRIEVGAKSIDGVIEVSVCDTGVGIALEDQEAVFEEFRQVGTADKKVEGTGLGLTLSRKFVELHGGRIWVKSQIGQGSTFTFTVPVHRGE